MIYLQKGSDLMNIAPTIVVNKDIIIRQPRESDIQERFAIGRSLEFRKMVGGSVLNIPPYEYDNAERLYKREMKNKLSWFIEYKGRMVGVCRLNERDNGLNRYSIGIYDEALFSQGIGTIVTNTVLDYAFKELKLAKVELMVLQFNKRAIRCYEKCGFVTKEILNDSLEVDGEKYNDIIMEKLNPYL